VENSKKLRGLSASLYRQAACTKTGDSQVFGNYQLATSQSDSREAWGEIDRIS